MVSVTNSSNEYLCNLDTCTIWLTSIVTLMTRKSCTGLTKKQELSLNAVIKEEADAI